MAKWIVGFLFLLLLVWFGLGLYTADQFLSIGKTKYDRDEELAFLEQAKLGDMVRSEVSIPNGAVTLAGSFYRQSVLNKCAVVMVPGIGGNRTQVLPGVAFFWELGCHVLLYDPRGTGASSDVLRTFGYHEPEDNVRAVEWMAETTGLPNKSIGVWGVSFGAAVGLLSLEHSSEIGFVIADSTFSDFERVAGDTITLLASESLSVVLTPLVLAILEFRTGLESEAISPKRSIRHVNVPVLLIHAREDPAMHVDHSKAVYENRTSDLVELEITDWGAAHGDSALVDPDAYRRLVRGFLFRHGTIIPPE